MKISVIHPSRGRSEMAFLTMQKWTTRADNFENIEYLMCIDKSDKTGYTYWSMQGLVTLLTNDNKSAIEAINFGATKATGDLLIVVSDDFDCPPHWDTLLIEALKGKSDFLVKTKDGLQPTLITLPIMDRVYYERFGYVYHPDYKHMFSDQEMTSVGNMLGKVIDLDIKFPHNHYTTGAMKKDAINIKNDSSWKQGERLFKERLKTNFGLKDSEIVKPYSSIVWH